MIRQLGSHRGKQIIFGYDRYLGQRQQAQMATATFSWSF